MPSDCAWLGVRGAIGLPPRTICPASGGCTPVRTLISVDLPAPFSPISAWISPARTVKSTPSSARTPGKERAIPRICRSSPGIGALLIGRGLRFRQGWVYSQPDRHLPRVAVVPRVVRDGGEVDL